MYVLSSGVFVAEYWILMTLFVLQAENHCLEKHWNGVRPSA